LSHSVPAAPDDDALVALARGFDGDGADLAFGLLGLAAEFAAMPMIEYPSCGENE